MAGRPLADLPDWARELLATERVARLGLLDEDDRPRVQPVTYAVAGDFVYTAIDDKPKRGEPARVRRLRRNPWAALTADRYSDNWSELAWVQVLGRVEVVPVEFDAFGFEALRAKYAQYAEHPPGGPLLRLVPERALSWRAED